jgi:hypothetical protein
MEGLFSRAVELPVAVAAVLDVDQRYRDAEHSVVGDAKKALREGYVTMQDALAEQLASTDVCRSWKRRCCLEVCVGCCALRLWWCPVSCCCAGALVTASTCELPCQIVQAALRSSQFVLVHAVCNALLHMPKKMKRDGSDAADNAANAQVNSECAALLETLLPREDLDPKLPLHVARAFEIVALPDVMPCVERLIRSAAYGDAGAYMVHFNCGLSPLSHLRDLKIQLLTGLGEDNNTKLLYCVSAWHDEPPCRCVCSSAVLHCAALRCAVLCCAVLCCAVLCCAVLCCAVLCCAVLCCAAL